VGAALAAYVLRQLSNTYVSLALAPGTLPSLHLAARGQRITAETSDAVAVHALRPTACGG
jgi:hypothetical protein